MNQSPDDLQILNWLMSYKDEAEKYTKMALVDLYKEGKIRFLIKNGNILAEITEKGVGPIKKKSQ